jgi:hypothetical protein
MTNSTDIGGVCPGTRPMGRRGLTPVKEGACSGTRRCLISSPVPRKPNQPLGSDYAPRPTAPARQSGTGVHFVPALGILPLSF